MRAIRVLVDGEGGKGAFNNVLVSVEVEVGSAGGVQRLTTAVHHALTQAGLVDDTPEPSLQMYDPGFSRFVVPIALKDIPDTVMLKLEYTVDDPRAPPPPATPLVLAPPEAAVGPTAPCVVCFDHAPAADGVTCGGPGQHFTCAACLSAFVVASCEDGTLLSPKENADGVVCPPGELPCPAFTAAPACPCGELTVATYMPLLDGDATRAYIRARERLAVQRNLDDTAAREAAEFQAAARAGAIGVVHAMVELALQRGLCWPCPGCGVLGQKNGACMHITCGVCSHKWCYACGLSYTVETNGMKCIRGRGLCDKVNSYFERNPGWEGLPQAPGETPGDAAVVHFQVKLSAFYVGVVRDMVPAGLWEACCHDHPGLLADVIAGRSVDVDAYGGLPPLFGVRATDPHLRQSTIRHHREQATSFLAAVPGVDALEPELGVHESAFLQTAGTTDVAAARRYLRLHRGNVDAAVAAFLDDTVVDVLPVPRRPSGLFITFTAMPANGARPMRFKALLPILTPAGSLTLSTLVDWLAANSRFLRTEILMARKVQGELEFLGDDFPVDAVGPRDILWAYEVPEAPGAAAAKPSKPHEAWVVTCLVQRPVGRGERRVGWATDPHVVSVAAAARCYTRPPSEFEVQRAMVRKLRRFVGAGAGDVTVCNRPFELTVTSPEFSYRRTVGVSSTPLELKPGEKLVARWRDRVPFKASEASACDLSHVSLAVRSAELPPDPQPPELATFMALAGEPSAAKARQFLRGRVSLDRAVAAFHDLRQATQVIVFTFMPYDGGVPRRFRAKLRKDATSDDLQDWLHANGGIPRSEMMVVEVAHCRIARVIAGSAPLDVFVNDVLWVYHMPEGPGVAARKAARPPRHGTAANEEFMIQYTIHSEAGEPLGDPYVVSVPVEAGGVDEALTGARLHARVDTQMRRFRAPGTPALAFSVSVVDRRGRRLRAIAASGTAVAVAQEEALAVVWRKGCFNTAEATVCDVSHPSNGH